MTKVLMKHTTNNLNLVIKEIADSNSCGMDAYIFKDSLKTIFMLSENNFDPDGLDELYAEDRKEIEDNIHNIIKIEVPDSRESFSIMESFVACLTDEKLKEQLTNTLNRNRPFANFKRDIYSSGEHENWHNHRNIELQKRVERQLIVRLKKDDDDL